MCTVCKLLLIDPELMCEFISPPQRMESPFSRTPSLLSQWRRIGRGDCLSALQMDP